VSLKQKKKIALVLSGGGVKAAAFHLGVCMALQERGFKFGGGTISSTEPSLIDDEMTFKIYVGSSAGALVCSLLASGYSVESIFDSFGVSTLNLKRRPTGSGLKLKSLSYLDIFSLNGSSLLKMVPSLLYDRSFMKGGIEALVKSGFRLNGIFTTKGLEKYLRTHVLPTNDFRELAVKLFVVATQLNHSRKVIFGPFDRSSKQKDIKWANYSSISDAVAASTSLPPVFAPYAIRDHRGKELHYFDGEIRDTLSTHVASDNGADLVISSYSIQPYHFNETMGSLHNHGIPLILNQALYQVVEQKIQKHISHQKKITDMLSIVDGYFRQANLPDEHRHRLVALLAERAAYKPNVDYVYIHPLPRDSEMFFADHFSLNPVIMGKIVKVGFRSALRALRDYESGSTEFNVRNPNPLEK
jgi:predicted acylesterase/phospholipase RssA